MVERRSLAEFVQIAATAVMDTLIEQVQVDENIVVSFHVANDGEPNNPTWLYGGIAAQGIFGLAIELMREQEAADAIKLEGQDGRE